MKKLFSFFAVMLLFSALISLTSCESCERDIKSFKSDFSGGLYRTLVVMDYEGDTLTTYTGKFDIRDDSSDNKIFFDLNGKRVWIQGGIVISEEQ